MLAQGHTELKAEVDEIKEDLKNLKMDLPILPIEANKITTAAKKKGVSILGGKQSNAYRDRSIRQRVYNNLYSKFESKNFNTPENFYSSQGLFLFVRLLVEF